MSFKIVCATFVVASLALGWVGAGSGGQGPGRAPTFSHPLNVTHPYSVFPPLGLTAAKCAAENTGQTETARVLPKTRTFEWNGQQVECRVVEEEEVEDDVLLETSENYFAQADDGTLYYFGEVVFVHDPAAGEEQSWLVGGPTLATDPADTLTAHQPTIFLPARMTPGATWKTEDLSPADFEQVLVTAFDKTVSTPAGVFAGCVELFHTGPENGDQHVKYFAPGIGEVLELKRDGWKELVELRVGF